VFVLFQLLLHFLLYCVRIALSAAADALNRLPVAPNSGLPALELVEAHLRVRKRPRACWHALCGPLLVASASPTYLEHGWELEKLQRVSCRGRVKDYRVVCARLDQVHNAAQASSKPYNWNKCCSFVANHTTVATSVARILRHVFMFLGSRCPHTHEQAHSRTHACTRTHARAHTLTQPARLGASLANLVQHLHCDVMRHAAMHYVVCRTSRAQWLRLCQGFL
jgi:hypothetical protein